MEKKHRHTTDYEAIKISRKIEEKKRRYERDLQKRKAELDAPFQKTRAEIREWCSKRNRFDKERGCARKVAFKTSIDARKWANKYRLYIYPCWHSRVAGFAGFLHWHTTKHEVTEADLRAYTDTETRVSAENAQTDEWSVK